MKKRFAVSVFPTGILLWFSSYFRRAWLTEDDGYKLRFIGGVKYKDKWI
jgi:hypothetical protein